MVVTAELPDNVSATAIALATTASGAFNIVMTPPLMTIEEGLEAMRKASGTGYRPPGHSRLADGSGLSKKPSPQCQETQSPAGEGFYPSQSETITRGVLWLRTAWLDGFGGGHNASRGAPPLQPGGAATPRALA